MYICFQEVMTKDPNNYANVKPTRKAVEQASHELPILKTRMKELALEKTKIEAEEQATQNEIDYYQSVMERTTSSFTDVKALELGISAALQVRSAYELEYLEKQTNADKILFVTRYPEFFGKRIFEGGKEIADFIEEIELKLIGIVSDSLHATIQSTVSRLYIKGSLLKFRFKGTKGKLVAIHPEWLDQNILNGDYSDIFQKIEPAPLDEESQALSQAS